MRRSRLAEHVVRGILGASHETTLGRARLKGLIESRKLLIRLGDPPIELRVGDVDLLMPLSHELPFYLHDHPAYSRNVARIAAQLGGPVVDVGANVGDTAALVRAETDAPILCVEGDERFFGLLETNAERIGGLELERAFVDAPAAGRVERSRGTARVVPGDGELPSKPLERILAEHPRFAEPALLKLDTDGMDVPILLGNVDLLTRLNPVVFFEYDPHLGAEPSVFARLREAGYERMHVYENTGEHVETVALPGAIHDRYMGHGGARYADVCVLPSGTDVKP